MIISSLLLLIFALFGVILTLSEYEYIAISGYIIVLLCFLVYLALCILWQTTVINAMEKQLKAKEEFIKYLKDIGLGGEKKDE